MLIRRLYEARLRTLLRSFPVVTVLGPRQAGKTTLARMTLPSWTYLDLERPSDHDRFAADSEHYLSEVSSRLILDEAQRVPSLFPVLRSVVDERQRQRGRFLLLGSASPSLIKGISESLAGRVGFLEMTPFLAPEVLGRRGGNSIGSLWLKGGFPHAILARSHRERFDWFESYLSSFLERDLPSYGVSVTPLLMRRLVTMLAHLHGGIWNASEMGSSLAIGYHVANRYLDVLEKSFLVRRLAPFFRNIGKRLVKSPKVYLRDSGLLHLLLGVRTPTDLLNCPKRGSSWEGLVIEQVLALERLRFPSSQFYFWRTSGGAEVDLLIQRGSKIIPIEIKTQQTPSRGDLRGLQECLKDLKLQKGYVITLGPKSYALASNISVISAGAVFRGPLLPF